MVEGTLKFGGGSVIVWGCMLWEGVGYACKIDRKMDKHLYTAILENDIQASIEYYGKISGEIIFQHDGCPKHIPDGQPILVGTLLLMDLIWFHLCLTSIIN